MPRVAIIARMEAIIDVVDKWTVVTSNGLLASSVTCTTDDLLDGEMILTFESTTDKARLRWLKIPSSIQTYEIGDILSL